MAGAAATRGRRTDLGSIVADEDGFVDKKLLLTAVPGLGNRLRIAVSIGIFVSIVKCPDIFLKGVLRFRPAEVDAEVNPERDACILPDIDIY
jgi:hypothetical protein